ncbi:MAG: hypothetical protein ACXWJ2_02020 [Hyphomicrobium sp.]
MSGSLDIKAKAPFPASALSNLAPHAITLACETVLTPDELCGRLERLRARLAADAVKSPAGGR